MKLHKYHGLGNDYLVLDSRDHPKLPDPETVRRVCDRNRGAGSDGILWGGPPNDHGHFPLRIFNPDGSEAEKSGNGLRIFARFLWDGQAIGETPFTIETPGGRVEAQVLEQGRLVIVEMGSVSFDSRQIPVAGDAREVVDEPIAVLGEELRYTAVTIGNPHCVVQRPATPEQAREWGKILENDPRFPNRTNVQFLEVLDRSAIRIHIWERGAGYTLASGSSSCAAAAAAHRLGGCDSEIAVHMPGGRIDVTIQPDYQIRMKGAVTRVGELILHPEAFEEAPP
ncbi:MAG: diaminopimelate epimerase [SAR324 cluster bacterium]|nr:diaminopimelate epimerase [SAR324 cluster bacterium]